MRKHTGVGCERGREGAGGGGTSLQLVTAHASEQSKISVNCLLGGSCKGVEPKDSLGINILRSERDKCTTMRRRHLLHAFRETLPEVLALLLLRRA